jgi:putative hemolysin
MSAIVIEVLFIIFLTVLSGVFAMSEIAIVASRKARLQQWANEGNAKAQAVLALANAPREFLSTVQIGITLVGVLAGAFGGATIAQQLGAHLNTVPFLAPYSNTIAMGLVVLGITYLSLVVGELAPKHIALSNAERVASLIAAPMHVVSKITSPAVRL